MVFLQKKTIINSFGTLAAPAALKTKKSVCHTHNFGKMHCFNTFDGALTIYFC